MTFDIITIFPQIFSAQGGSTSDENSCAYFGTSIIKRALNNNLIKINTHNLRNYTTDKHRTVDDTPYGGGAGMVMKVKPIFDCVNAIKQKKGSEVKNQKDTITVLFSAKGKRYTQQDAVRLSQYKIIIMICGRYEGVDERVAEHIADEEISIGDYVLTGGELPAMVVIDSITRLIPGVLGNPKSLIEESFSMTALTQNQNTKSSCEIESFKKIYEYPQYTKPEEFFPEGKSVSDGRSWKVPNVLLSGNHAEIEKWRKEKSNEK
ncbi:MAG: tRNA (guanine-N(1)-)-methyltransferase [Candidatus Moranbacteria bacterium GW2011_GWE2_35_2-]|nr:MAG: tRNA (guanine-N(1)-)-methyltransferase [Candidatus Moranbacteria bacterium GW2011_GWE2_35_2-]KKQ06019.1 MAG: tRNA (guanine-N(1)-)-methyltransferase [Candidatus Moranbacteria bacterium GW2011_GWF1_36_4]KKQ22813.1 MAG: tRNA (guanine-N(1)-)-methyltransferase [Candidatus Moranbacteria bacterium GW2011_GWF2_37_11]KKQ28824.1 MAG: tRNA (guanine-N(1)-)-methyltransferase [Candidatus Moranbacteria bacterium GW2011_GWD1_37_17]KKQ30956.1 MAG: tRNA (guanine-N(1)-)-methyltransferase [Candidatus Moran